MRRDVLELRAFYASARGRAAREMIGRKLAEAWGDPRGLEFLGLGYATPYLESIRERARRTVAVMPATQGVEVWPAEGRNLAFLSDETSLPLPNALFDRVVCVHALEEAEDAIALMQEVCRVLAPSGRVIVAVAASSRTCCAKPTWSRPAGLAPSTLRPSPGPRAGPRASSRPAPGCGRRSP